LKKKEELIEFNNFKAHNKSEIYVVKLSLEYLLKIKKYDEMKMVENISID
jgi:hypothetical protein